MTASGLQNVFGLVGTVNGANGLTFQLRQPSISAPAKLCKRGAHGGSLRLGGIRRRTDGYHAFDVGKLFGDNLADSQLA